MRTLTSAERRAFRAKAHPLRPIVSIGQHGLTAAVLHEIDVNLLAHELIKIRVFSDSRSAREELLERICNELDAAPVQHLGKILTIWRPAPEPEAAAEPRRKPAEGMDRRRQPNSRRGMPHSRVAPAGSRGQAPKAAPADPGSRRRKPGPRGELPPGGIAPKGPRRRTTQPAPFGAVSRRRKPESGGGTAFAPGGAPRAHRRRTTR